MTESLHPLPGGWRPPETWMASAPIVDSWRLELRAEGHDVVLIGIVYGHPGRQDGVHFESGALVAWDEEEGWACCLGRGFRLGARAA